MPDNELSTQNVSEETKNPVLKVFEYHSECFDRIRKVVYVCRSGFHLAAQRPKLINVLKNTIPEEEQETQSEKHAKDLKEAEDVAGFCKGEEAKGFSGLYAHFFVANWAQLQAFIEDFWVAIVVENPKLLSADSFEKYKIPINRAFVDSKDSAARFVFAEVSNKLKAKGMFGHERFEEIFRLIGFSKCEVSQENKLVLREAGALRNVLAHKGGIADERLSNSFAQYEFGAEVRITSEKYYQTLKIIQDYLLDLATRSRIVRFPKERVLEVPKGQ